MIDSFTGEYRFLSNFWPVDIQFAGETYPSVEHAYVAAKTTNEHLRKRAREIKDPGEVKKFGRVINLRVDWEDVKLDYMSLFVRRKFDHKDLAERLVDTYPHGLVEGNHWGDTFWGVCRGKGKNHLGKILMAERSLLWLDI